MASLFTAGISLLPLLHNLNHEFDHTHGPALSADVALVSPPSRRVAPRDGHDPGHPQLHHHAHDLTPGTVPVSRRGTDTGHETHAPGREPVPGSAHGHDDDEHGADSILHLCGAVTPADPPSVELPSEQAQSLGVQSDSEEHQVRLGLPRPRGPPPLNT